MQSGAPPRSEWTAHPALGAPAGGIRLPVAGESGWLVEGTGRVKGDGVAEPAGESLRRASSAAASVGDKRAVQVPMRLSFRPLKSVTLFGGEPIF